MNSVKYMLIDGTYRFTLLQRYVNYSDTVLLYLVAWSEALMAPLSLWSTRAIARLRAYVPPSTIWPSLPLSRRAAVLVLLFADRHGDLRVVLTLRSSTLSSYAGHVSFPGGKADSLDETPFQIARREAYEEIGLPNNDSKLPRPMQVEHLCELPTNLASTELGVVPCVALLHTGDDTRDPEESLLPRLDAKEVSAVFSAPFHQFLSEYCDEKEQGPKWYKGYWSTWHDTSWRMHHFYIPRSVKNGQPSAEEPYKVFGMTARIAIDAARMAYADEPTFEHNTEAGDEEILRKLVKMGRFSVERKPGSQLSREDMVKVAKM